MEKSINIQIEEFRSNLLNLVNNSGLPAAMVYYIYKDIGKEVENAYYSVLNAEAPVEQEYSDPSMKPDPDQMPEQITSKEELNNYEA